eukprot:jgi/Mesen1/1353/ME000013S00844
MSPVLSFRKSRPEVSAANGAAENDPAPRVTLPGVVQGDSVGSSPGQVDGPGKEGVEMGVVKTGKTGDTKAKHRTGGSVGGGGFPGALDKKHHRRVSSLGRTQSDALAGGVRPPSAAGLPRTGSGWEQVAAAGATGKKEGKHAKSSSLGGAMAPPSPASKAPPGSEEEKVQNQFERIDRLFRALHDGPSSQADRQKGRVMEALHGSPMRAGGGGLTPSGRRGDSKRRKDGGGSSSTREGGVGKRRERAKTASIGALGGWEENSGAQPPSHARASSTSDAGRLGEAVGLPGAQAGGLKTLNFPTPSQQNGPPAVVEAIPEIATLPLPPPPPSGAPALLTTRRQKGQQKAKWSLGGLWLNLSGKRGPRAIVDEDEVPGGSDVEQGRSGAPAQPLALNGAGKPGVLPDGKWAEDSMPASGKDVDIALVDAVKSSQGEVNGGQPGVNWSEDPHPFTGTRLDIRPLMREGVAQRDIQGMPVGGADLDAKDVADEYTPLHSPRSESDGSSSGGFTDTEAATPGAAAAAAAGAGRRDSWTRHAIRSFSTSFKRFRAATWRRGGRGGGDMDPPHKPMRRSTRIVIGLVLLALFLAGVAAAVLFAGVVVIALNAHSCGILWYLSSDHQRHHSPAAWRFLKKTTTASKRAAQGPVNSPPPRYGAGGASGSCTGLCCSSNPPRIGYGEPVMPNAWWSSSLPHNGQVQLMSDALRAWVGPPPGDSWEAPFLSSARSNPPPSSDFLVVVRPSGASKNTSVQFVASNQKFLEALPNGGLAATGSSTYPILNPLSIAVLLETSESGRYLSVSPRAPNGLGFLRLTGKPGQNETFSVREVTDAPAIRGANLGGWLVAEDWMAPDLFSGVPHMLDGTSFTLQSASTGGFVYSPGNTNYGILRSDGQKDFATFYLRRTPAAGQPAASSDYQMRLAGTGNFVAAARARGSAVYANFSSPTQNGSSSSATFKFHFLPADPSLVMIESATGGLFWQVASRGRLLTNAKVSAKDLANSNSPAWKGSTAFRISVKSEPRGEWQLSAGLGPAAADVLNQHRATFVSESDFQYMQSRQVNAARVPIGYWLTQGGEPDAPFVAGGLEALDLAFSLGAKYGVRIYISMHGARGSQNGFEHSGSRDQIAEFATPGLGNVNATLDAIEFLAARYTQKLAFLGIGLLNEPATNVVPLDVLKNYYERGFAIVRKYSPCAYVGIDPYLDSDYSSLDGFMTSPYYNNVIFDVHLYHVFGGTFVGKSAEYNIEYVRTTSKDELARLEQGTRLLMVGEWSQALLVEDASNDDVARFGAAQLDTYGGTSGGWFFWSLKVKASGLDNWSFKDSQGKGWLKETSRHFW